MTTTRRLILEIRNKARPKQSRSGIGACVALMLCTASAAGNAADGSQIQIYGLVGTYVDSLKRSDVPHAQAQMGSGALTTSFWGLRGSEDLGATLGASSAWSVMVLASSAYAVIGTTTVMLYLYTPEIYPTRMRAIGTGLATSWLRAASAVAPAIVGVVLSGQGIAAVFLMFACATVLNLRQSGRLLGANP